MRTAPWRSWAFLLTIVLLRAAEPQVLACSVCFGDPESAMAKGAVMGVLTLGGIIGSVLLMIVGTGAFWLHRSMKLARASNVTNQYDTPI